MGKHNHSMAGSQATFGAERPKGAANLNRYHATLAEDIESLAATEARARRARKDLQKALADSLRACK